jgi:hypothetical protein
MQRNRQVIAGVMSVLAAATAAVVFALFSVPVRASATCTYETKTYSQGACIRSICESPFAQQCQEDGSWGNCKGCVGGDPD